MKITAVVNFEYSKYWGCGDSEEVDLDTHVLHLEVLGLSESAIEAAAEEWMQENKPEWGVEYPFEDIIAYVGATFEGHIDAL